MDVNDEHAAGLRDGEHAAALWRNPLVHLGACVAIGALVILVINAIGWLT